MWWNKVIDWWILYDGDRMKSRGDKRMVNKGFTLIEILIAVAIMGILASVGFGAYTVSLQKSRDAARKSDLSQIAKAIEAYNNDYGVYPGSCGGAVGGCGNGRQSCDWGKDFSVENRVYMKRLPVESKSGWTYVYLVGADRKSYQLYARLENEKDPNFKVLKTSCTTSGEACTYGVSSANVDLEPPLSSGSC